MHSAEKSSAHPGTGLIITSKPLLIVQWLIHKGTVADIYYGIVIKKVHKAQGYNSDNNDSLVPSASLCDGPMASECCSYHVQSREQKEKNDKYDMSCMFLILLMSSVWARCQPTITPYTILNDAIKASRMI